MTVWGRIAVTTVGLLLLVAAVRGIGPLTWAAAAGAAVLLAVPPWTLARRGRLAAGIAREQQTALAELLRRILPPWDMQSLADQAIVRLVGLTGAARGAIWLAGAGPPALAASVGVRRASPAGEPDAAAEALFDMLREPEDRSERLAEAARPLTAGSPSEALLVERICHEGELFGAVILARVGGEFRAADRRFASSVAAVLAGGIAVRRALAGVQDSWTDPVTGTGTRRVFEDHYRREIARARRTSRPLSLAMLDVDGLKAINDGWGHAVGDDVLARLGRILRDVRTSDVVARFGGDEFVILMPETDRDQADAALARVREGITRLNEEGVFPFPVRVSIGVAELTPGDPDLLRGADAAMYLDKRAARGELGRQMEDPVPPPERGAGAGQRRRTRGSSTG